MNVFALTANGLLLTCNSGLPFAVNVNLKVSIIMAVPCKLLANFVLSLYCIISICYGAAQRRHNLFCRIHENVFKLYLWCIDDFLTD